MPQACLVILKQLKTSKRTKLLATTLDLNDGDYVSDEIGRYSTAFIVLRTKTATRMNGFGSTSSFPIRNMWLPGQ